MGDGTKEKPYTREDVLRLIKENGGTAKDLDLSGKEFEEGIDLCGLNLCLIILREAKLWNANLKEIDLRGAKLEKANLLNANLRKANLEAANLQWASLTRANLEEASLVVTDLRHAFLRDANLQKADLHRTELEGAFLHEVKLYPDTRLQYADWGNYILGEEEYGRFYWAVATYRQLRVWHKNAGFFDREGEFLLREMIAKRKLYWWGGDQPRGARAIFPAKPFRWARSKLLSILCGYGERPFKVVASAAVVIFGLAAAYYFWGSFSSSSFWDTLYYSAASFTALGYGNWAPQPIGWAKAMGAAEAFIGVFSMALFLITFTRKMTR